MKRAHKVLLALLIIVSFCVPAGAQKVAEIDAARPKPKGSKKLPAVLWRDPEDIATKNLLYGAGSKERTPTGRFKFLKEETRGHSPKFDVEDEEGARWRVKVGPEARSETAATRLLWAVGYFTDEDYYMPELHVEGMQKLSRGQEFVTADGIVRGAGLERRQKGRKKIGPWSWSKNPFVGTKQLNGLRVMMALMNNWDLKSDNNSIYDEQGLEYHYVVSDVGATFGRSGNTYTRTKDNLEHYSRSEFIRETTPEDVDFFLASHPHPLNVLIFPHLINLRMRERIVKSIPRADAKWIGQLLYQLSAEQIGDCFRTSGHSPEEVEGYTKAVQERIRALEQL